MEILTKLSIKSCMASPELEIVTVDGKQVTRAKGEQSLMRVIGQAEGIRRGQSDFGPWIAFLGYFEATNAKTGEVFRSSKVLFPDSFAGMLAAAINVEEMTDDNNDAQTASGKPSKTKTGYGTLVQFAVDIGCKPANTPTGYQYTVKPLIESGANDPLAGLRLQLKEMPLLGAPSAEKANAKKAPEKAKA